MVGDARIGVRQGPARTTPLIPRFGAGGLLFYPFIALAAAALIILSMGPAVFARSPAPQAGKVEAGAISFDASAIAGGLETGADHVSHVVRDGFGPPTAVRIAITPGRGEPGEAEAGAQLLLEPQLAQRLAGRPVTVEISYRRLFASSASRLAVSLQEPGPVAWVTGVIPPEEKGVMVLALPAGSGGAPDRLGLRPVEERTEFAYGVEISRIVLRPAT